MHHDWNISRMECKDYSFIYDVGVKAGIGIYPEWNVKKIH